MNIISLILISCLFASCMFRNPETCLADDVRNTWITETDGTFYLINLETVFQTTSREFQGGHRTLHGHEVFRISVYDIETGELSARRKISRSFWPVIGMAGTNIWLYDKKKGIYSIDSITLEDRYSEKDILRRNPSFNGQFFQAGLNLLHKYFGIDPGTENLILTDDQGIRHMMVPETLELMKYARDSMPVRAMYVYSNYLSDNVEIAGIRYTLEGDLRKSLAVDGYRMPDAAFINGFFLLSGKKQDLLNNMEHRKASEKDMSRKRDMEDELSELDDESLETMYIIHGSSIAEDAQLQFSRIKLTDNAPDLAVQWTTTVPDVFHNPEHAGGTSRFRWIFSRGNPSYRYRFYYAAGRYFVFIHQLHAGFIDTENGELLRVIRL